jgi:hypothetical protein
MGRTLFTRLRGALLLALTISAVAAAQGAAPPVPPRPSGPPKKTWERALTVAARPTPAGVRYQLNVSESTILAANVAEFTTKLRDAGTAMVEVRSGRSPGSYTWGISTPWETEMNMGRCLFKNIDVRILLDVDVVALGGPVAADSAALAWWEGQLDELWAGHVARLRVMRDAARALYQEVKLLSNPSCSEIATRANELTRKARLDLAQSLAGMGGRMTPLRDPE